MNLSSVSGIRIKTSMTIVGDAYITIKMVMECIMVGYCSISYLICKFLIIPQLINIIYLTGKRKTVPLRYPITNPSDDIEMEPSLFDISSVQELVRGTLKLEYVKNNDSNQFTLFKLGIFKVF